MKFKHQIEKIRAIGHYPYLKPKNLWLHFLVVMMLAANSLLVAGAIEYLAPRQSSRAIENRDRQLEPLDNVTRIKNINFLNRIIKYNPLLSEYRALLLTISAGLLTYSELILLANYWKRSEARKFLPASKDVSGSEIEMKQKQVLLADEEANSNIEQSEKAIDREPYLLIANMSHELRSPLNSILGFAQIIEQELSTTPNSIENVAIINRSGEHLLSIINDVVDLAKIEIERLTLEQNNVDFYTWLDNIKQSFKFQACDRGWEFSLIIQNDLPKYICVDERRLRQIIENLINYCLKSELPGSVSLIISSHPCQEENIEPKTPASDGRHIICFEFQNSNFLVTDTELAALFDPLVKVGKEQKYTKGSSLSLPLGRKLSQLMGGDLTVKNNGIENSGIVFNLEIPVTSVSAEKLEIQPIYQKIVGLEPDGIEYRILVVDDSKTNRKIMLQLLESVGFQVREATDGKEAIDVWLDWQPHMIWMDLRMPVMNGCEATERIRSYSRDIHIPIVALSASTLEEEKSLFKAAGCDDFVEKPFSDKIIFDKIAQHLGIRYVYEPITPVKPNHFQLTADALNVMSNEWLSQVEQAAIELDGDLLTQLLQKIPAEHEELKNALQKQVNNFDFDLILNLIERSQSN